MKQISLRLLAVLLVLLLLPVLPVQTGAAENRSIRLSDADVSGGNVPFYAENMFPGDAVTQDFVIRVSHREPVQLHYRADIRPGYETLAEVLMITIALPEQDVTLYDGLMRDMPASLTHTMGVGEDSLRYRITVYLPTSVGNPYQNQALIADFRWWYLEEDPAPVSVKLAAEKTLDGQYARGRKFSFCLMDEQGTVLQTVKNRDGLIEFDSLTFTQPGTYLYSIRELPGHDSQIDYDPAVYQVKITVTEEDGVLTAAVAYRRNGEKYHTIPRFMNTTQEYQRPSHPSEETPDNPKTGDTFPLKTYLAIAGGSLFALLLLLILKGRREEEDHG